MIGGPRRALGALALAAALAPAGCAKDATSVLVTVDADPSVPPILLLETIVAPSDPNKASSTNFPSPNGGDADRPGPFVFPIALDLTVDASFAGPVVVTIEGLDWDTYAVIARGSTDATVQAQKRTNVSLTLEPIRGGAGDGGTD
jgi:hypothetical protein